VILSTRVSAARSIFVPSTSLSAASPAPVSTFTPATSGPSFAFSPWTSTSPLKLSSVATITSTLVVVFGGSGFGVSGTGFGVSGSGVG